MPNPYVNFAGRVVPQTEKAEPNQVKNNAGGFVFQVSDKTRIERFLILGTTGGTYYQNEQDLTKQNAEDLVAIILRDPMLVIATIREVVSQRRALRPSPAIFLTALLFKNAKNLTGETKQTVYFELGHLVSQICSTATQLFELCEYFKLLGGWSRARRNAVASWYEDFSVEGLALQMVKYRQRGGWTHADALRVSHAHIDPVLAKFAKRFYKAEQNVVGELSVSSRATDNLISLFEEAQTATNPKNYLRIAELGRLPWEAFPTSVHKDLKFWKALFYSGQIRNQALVRNVLRIAKLNGFSDIKFARDYADKLLAEVRGLHPLNYLNAFMVYTQGQRMRNQNQSFYGVREPKTWTSESVITDALQQGFYDSFARVTPSGKRIMLALDVSGSMGSMASGLDMTCAQLCGVMAMSIARTEKYHMIRAFAGTFKELNITPSMDLNTVFQRVHDNNFGSTDCSLPMVWAEKNKVEIDTFVVLTDSETYAGRIHPHKALESYRQKMGIGAGQIVVSATATPFTIADPNDAKTLDVVGGDSNLPRLISEFC